jgi:hypothetical protein
MTGLNCNQGRLMCIDQWRADGLFRLSRVSLDNQRVADGDLPIILSVKFVSGQMGTMSKLGYELVKPLQKSDSSLIKGRFA